MQVTSAAVQPSVDEPCATAEGLEGPGVTDAVGQGEICVNEPDTTAVSQAIPTIGPHDARR